MKNQKLTADCGRSMIEMLGVLTVIGLLSILGIYGYLRAMDKLDLTKQAQQVNQFSTAMIDFLDRTRTSAVTVNSCTTSFVELGYLPDSMTINASNGNTFLDNFSNVVQFINPSDETIGIQWNFSSKDQFMNIIQNLKNYASKIRVIYIRGKVYWYGDRVCTTRGLCLFEKTLADFQEVADTYSTGGYFDVYFYRA